jgi:hypothetical protein
LQGSSTARPIVIRQLLGMARTDPRYVSSRALIPGHLVSLQYRNPSFYCANTWSMVHLAASLSHLQHNGTELFDLSSSKRLSLETTAGHEEKLQDKTCHRRLHLASLCRANR